YVAKSDVAEAVKLGGELALYDSERLSQMSGAKVHLKIDALLGRQGVLPSKVDCLLDALENHPSVELVAAYGHYANIEDTTDLVHALDQRDAFDAAFELVRQRYHQVVRHLSATSGLM